MRLVNTLLSYCETCSLVFYSHEDVLLTCEATDTIAGREARSQVNSERGLLRCEHDDGPVLRNLTTPHDA